MTNGIYKRRCILCREQNYQPVPRDHDGSPLPPPNDQWECPSCVLSVPEEERIALRVARALKP